MKKTIAFISTNWASPWGGSEVLWSESALKLATLGHKVAASVYAWPKPASKLTDLRRSGIHIFERRFSGTKLGPPILQKLSGALIREYSRRSLETWVDRLQADLVCVCAGSPFDDLRIARYCRSRNYPYAVIVQAHAEHLWPDDERARELMEIFTGARRIFFVSRRNYELLESQLGVDLPNGDVVRNPFNVRPDVKVPWPESQEVLKLACVARLEPPAKGQDILLSVLAKEEWRSRTIQVSFFGKGCMEAGLRRQAARLGLESQVRFAGHVEDVESIWATHHGLILPSRFEGLPLAIVEAMMCGRVPIVTDVAGNTEFVDDGETGFVAEAATVPHLCSAMERAWKRRSDWYEIGKRAAQSIRQRMCSDPATDFVSSVLGLCSTGSGGDAVLAGHVTLGSHRITSVTS